MQLWSRGYFCATVGAVTEDQIKAYIENQSEEDEDFKIWDEAKESAQKMLNMVLEEIYGV